MFDFLLRELPNGRIIVRNIRSGEITNLSPAELGPFFEEQFEGSLASSTDELDATQRLMDEIAKRGL